MTGPAAERHSDPHEGADSNTLRSDGPGGLPAWTPDGFLDAASGLPMSPVAERALTAARRLAWSDPSRRHGPGRDARRVLDLARQSLAAELGCRAEEVRFVSSGSLALQWAVLGVLAARPGRVVTSAVERIAVLRAADRAEHLGFRHVEVGVDASGTVDRERMAVALGPGTEALPAPALVCLQQANPEVGTRQPVDDVAEILRGTGVPLLVDATGAGGVVSFPDQWSLLAADARMWGGPPGVGVLAVRAGTRWQSPVPIPDDPVATTSSAELDVAAVAAAATALEDARRWRDAEAARLFHLTERLRRGLARIPDVAVHGPADRRLPHLVAFSALYVDGEALLERLGSAGFWAHSGSACVSDTHRPSHVLAAMGALSQGNVRLSLPPGCPSGTIDSVLTVIASAITELRTEAGL